MISRVYELLKSIELNPLLSGISLFSIPVFSLLIASVLFICGLSVNALIFPAAIILSFLLIFFRARGKKNLLITSIIFHVAIILFSLFIATNFYDYSYDGIRYHQDMVYQLKDGWNPVWEHYAPGSKRIWVHHYTKGIETIAAAIYATIGTADAGKAVNFIFVFSSLFFVYRFIADYYPALSRKYKLFLSILFAFPVPVINQLLTFYIDWTGYTLLLILVSTLLCLEKKPQKLYYILIGCVIALSAAVKFNIFFWMLYAVFFYCLHLLLKKELNRLKKIMVIGFYGCITGVFILSFNPYLTNTINHQNPFYPLSGNEDVDIMTGNTPQLLKDKNRIESVFISLFSFPTHEEEDNMHIPFAVPSNLSFQKIMDSGKVDTRVGGFGLFFPWILLVSLLLYGLLYFTEKRKDLKYYNYILLLLFFSLFVLPSGWWARYVSFFYAFPLIILLSTLKYSYKKWVKVFHFAIYFMLVANMLISVIITCGTSLYKRNEIDTYLDIFLASEIPVNINFGGNTAFELKMKEAHIKYTEIPTEQADTIILFETLHLQSDQLLSLLKKKK